MLSACVPSPSALCCLLLSLPPPQAALAVFVLLACAIVAASSAPTEVRMATGTPRKLAQVQTMWDDSDCKAPSGGTCDLGAGFTSACCNGSVKGKCTALTSGVGKPGKFTCHNGSVSRCCPIP